MSVVNTSATISGRPRTGLLVLHYYRLAGQPPVTTLVIIIISMMSSNTFIRQYLHKTIEIDIHTKVLISNEQQSLNFFSESHMFSASRSRGLKKKTCINVQKKLQILLGLHLTVLYSICRQYNCIDHFKGKTL